MNTPPPQTAQEYIHLVRQLAAITDRAMDHIQDGGPITLEPLDRIAQNVETIACLRGDSTLYESTRPDGLNEYQKEMYAIENNLRGRLIDLGYSYPAARSLDETV